ncbi:MAG: sulfatase [Phycisphaerae bacterium]|nr:sulfatase [Phycisphaerae bacterium]
MMKSRNGIGRRQFLKAVCAGAAVTSLPIMSVASAAKKSSSSKRPNIVFLYTDDQRYDTLGCMGNKHIKTPNLDKLGNDGVIFDNHYNNTAICMASRAIVMSGMHEYKNGCNFMHGPLDRKYFDTSYPVLLREAGYYTGFAGKFGFGVADADNPDRSWKKDENMPIADFDYWAGWPDQGTYKTEDNGYIAKFKDKYPHTTRALGAAGQEFIGKAKESGKPFCLSVSFKAPHGPASPDKEYDDLYDGVVFPKPENYGLKGAEHLCDQARSGRQAAKFSAWEGDKYQEHLSKYYRQIYGIDVAVGMIRDELETQGVADNTVVIFMTDNGYSCGSHAFGGKVLPYEEASKSPLLIFDPRKPASKRGKRSRALTGSIDMSATMLDLGGVAVPDHTDGESIVPLLDNPNRKIRKHMLFTQVWGPLSNHALTVLTGDFKYTYWMYGDDGMTPCEELYDINADPIEMENLVGEKKFKGTLKKMRRLYDGYVEQWKKDCYKDYGYPEHGILADRHLSWDEKKKLVPLTKSKNGDPAIDKRKVNANKIKQK